MSGRRHARSYHQTHRSRAVVPYAHGILSAGPGSSGAPLAATLAEAWNGTTWSIQPTPNPAGTSEGLDLLAGVSCRSAASCTAVGSSAAGGSSTTAPLGEAWNGTAWSIVRIPAPTRFASALAGVWCGPTTCVAAGYYRDGSGTGQALAEVSGGGAWAVQPAPDPSGAVPSTLAGVSCGAPTACIAVGSYDNSTGTSLTLAQTWNGTAWRVQHTPDPAGLRHSSLVSVSCTSASACMAEPIAPSTVEPSAFYGSSQMIDNSF